MIGIGCHTCTTVESTIVIVCSASYVTGETLPIGHRWSSATSVWINEVDAGIPVEKFSISYRLPGQRKPKPPPQRAAVTPWQPKRILRELAASWACSIRSFAGR